MKETMRNALIIMAISAIIASLFMSITALMILQGSGWVTITQKCVERTTTAEWISNNCRQEGNDKICKVGINGVSFETSIANINFEQISLPCKTFVDEAQVLIRKVKQ